jgi:signal transduction histidine kinase
MGQTTLNHTIKENSILSSDRMNMLEALMGSVAHEVRNPLAVVRGNLQLMLWKEDLESQHGKFKEMIEKLDGAMEMLTEFLQTLKPQLNAPAATDVNAIILSISRLLRAEAVRHGHEISFELGKKLPTMMINPSQMIHLLYNMCFIAFRYMDVSGEVVVSTAVRDDNTLVCLVVSAAKGCRLNSSEAEGCSEKADQLSRVCKKIADSLGARAEIRPHASQGAEVSVVFPI